MRVRSKDKYYIFNMDMHHRVRYRQDLLTLDTLLRYPPIFWLQLIYQGMKNLGWIGPATPVHCTE